MANRDHANGQRLPVDLAELLPPGQPGRLVRAAGFWPGSRQAAEQIVTHADYWRLRAEQALVGPSPLLAVVGDSLAQGIGAADPRDGYVGLVHRALGGDEALGILNLSRSGARMNDVICDQLPLMAELGVEPLATVCSVGSNDLLRSARVGRQRSEIERLIEDLPSSTVVVTVPAAGSLAAKVFNRKLRAAASARGLAVADVGARLNSWRGRRAGDGFHPNEVGYRLWGETVAAALTEHLITIS